MPNTVPVKLFHPGQAGAPVLSGTVGSLIALLDACLVNGYNLLALDAISVAAGVATATRAGGITFAVDDVVLISGCSNADLNGEWRVTESTGTTFKFACPTVANGSPVTAGSAKIAALGWTKLYSGTNKAVYARTEGGAPAAVLRVDDANAKFARVRGYESMTDADTGVGPFPTDIQVADGNYWHKSGNADAVARAWLLLGDGLRFVFCPSWRNAAPYSDAAHGGHSTYVFGALNSWKAADAYPDLISGTYSASANYPADYHSGLFHAYESGVQGNYLTRSFSQVGGAVGAHQNEVFSVAFSGADTSSNPAFPNPVNNGLELVPVYMREVQGTVNGQDPIRGTWPGAYFIPQEKPYSHMSKIDSHPSFPGKKLLIVATAYSSTTGRMAFDITGPWS